VGGEIEVVETVALLVVNAPGSVVETMLTGETMSVVLSDEIEG